MTRPRPPRSYIMREGSNKREYVDDVGCAMERHMAARQAAVDNLRDAVVIVSVTAAVFVALWFAL